MPNRRSELTAIIGAKTSGFRRGISRVASVAKGAGKAIGKMGIAAGAAATGYAALVKNTSDYVDKLRRQTSMTGLAIKQQQKLNYLANQFGIEEEAMADAVKEASMRMSEMAAGGAQIAAESVKALGTDAKTLANLFNKDVGKAMEFVSKRMEGMSRGKQGMIVDQLFGGQGGEKIRRMLTGNAEAIGRVSSQAEKFGLLSKQMTQDTIAFNKEMGKLTRVVTQATHKFVALHAEGLTKVSKAVRKFLQEDLTTKNIITFTAKVVKGIIKIQSYFRQVGNIITGIWQGVSESLSDHWAGVYKLLTGGFKGVKSGAEVAFKGVGNAIISGVEFGVNQAIKGINNLSSVLAKIPGVTKEAVEMDKLDFGRMKAKEAKAEFAGAKEEIKRASKLLFEANTGQSFFDEVGKQMKENNKVRAQEKSLLADINQWKRKTISSEEKERKEQEKGNKALKEKIKNLKTVKEIMGEEAPLAFGTPKQQVSALTKGTTGGGKEKTTDSLKGQFAEAATLTSRAGFRTGIRRAGERELASIKKHTGKSAGYLKNIQDKQAKTYSMN